MRELLKRVFFAIYVGFVRMRSSIANVPHRRRTFIWKYAWFFLWHRFLWSAGRSALSLVTEVRPLEKDAVTGEMERRYARFNELSSRDYQALPLHEKLMRPTRYVLAEDTARELCLLYMCAADAAPWQYGVTARRSARDRMRLVCSLSLFFFILLCVVYVPGSTFFAWAGYLLFNLLVITAGGWYADSCLLLLAEEGTRIREEQKTP